MAKKRGTPPPKRESLMLAWGQLLRLPNLFTAWADILAGFAWYQSLRPAALAIPPGGRRNLLQMLTARDGWDLGLLLLASSGLYLAGMVLNDVGDVAQDQQERPDRPIPSNRISLSTARTAGWGLLGCGVLAALAVSMLNRQPLPSVLGIGLAACVVLYNFWAKRTPLGGILMGACRGLNLLLGMSLLGRFSSLDLALAGSMALYIAGVTWYARSEAKRSPRPALLVSSLVQGFAIVTLTSVLFSRLKQLQTGQELPVWLLAMLVSVPLFRRLAKGVVTPEPVFVQQAVKLSLLTLIALNACTAYTAAGSAWAMLVLALLGPTLLLGKFLYST